jgi:hypothetical protein
MSGRDRIVLAIVLALAAVAGSWLLVIQPQRDQASKLGKQVSAAEAQLASERALVAQDEAARNSFASSYTQLARLGEAVPTDDNVPSLIYELQGAASATGVDFRSLTLQSSSGSSTPPPSTPASGKSGASTTGSTAAPGSAQAASALVGGLPPGASIGPAGFPEEQFAFTFQGNFFHLANFFKRLDNFVVTTNKRVSVSGRLMTLNAFSLGPAPQGFPAITASISATTYLVPSSQGLLAGASPLGPAGSSTQATSGSGSTTTTPPTAAITP